MNTKLHVLAIRILTASLLISSCGRGQLPEAAVPPTGTPVPVNIILASNVNDVAEIARVGRDTVNNADPVLSIAFSPDGKLLASGDRSGIVNLWDVASGEKLQTLTDFLQVHSVAFSPDGTVLVSASDDLTVKLWDTASGQLLHAISGGPTVVTSVAFSPDGRILAMGSGHGSIKLWDTSSEDELRALGAHTGWVSSVFTPDGVNSIAFSPDGKMLASGSRDGAVRLWDVASGDELRTLSGHTDAVTAVAFSPDGKIIASASFDSMIRFWGVLP